MGGIERGDPSVAQACIGADDPWPRPGNCSIPTEFVGGGIECTGDGKRLMLSSVSGCRSDVTAEQFALAQLGDVTTERTRQGSSSGLHIADLGVRPSLHDGPSRRRQVPVQRQNQDGH